MAEKVLATKNNFTLITKISTIILLIVYILIPPANEIFKLLNIVAIIGIIIVLILTIIQLMQPKEVIIKKDNKIYINKINKIIALEIGVISTINIKYKSSRGFKHQFGTIIIYTKTNKIYKVSNINSIDEVKRELNSIINK